MKLSSTREKSANTEILRVHTEEVAVIDGLLRCSVSVKSLCSDLEEISEENPEEGRRSAGRSWIRRCRHRKAVRVGPGEDLYIRAPLRSCKLAGESPKE